MAIARRIVVSLPALVLAGSRKSPAQTPVSWRPTGDIELVLGAAAGSAVDRIARSLQGLMRNAPGVRGLNVPMVNKPGAGQTAAMTYMAKHRGSPNHLS